MPNSNSTASPNQLRQVLRKRLYLERSVPGCVPRSPIRGARPRPFRCYETCGAGCGFSAVCSVGAGAGLPTMDSRALRLASMQTSFLAAQHGNATLRHAAPPCADRSTRACRGDPARNATVRLLCCVPNPVRTSSTALR